MFPSQLTVARKNRNGTMRPVFLGEEGSDYCISVSSLFSLHTGMKRKKIEDAVRELELKSRNHKIVRCIALIMSRKSEFVPPSPLDAAWVRMQAFTRLGHPAVSPAEREKVLEEIASSGNVPLTEAAEGLYADMEGEQILVRPYAASPGRLAKEFNLEQVETLLLKCSELRIYEVEDWHRVIMKLKRLGLLFSPSVDGNHELQSISVSGPLSVLEKTQRYGARIAMLFRYLSRFGRWRMEAHLTMKNRETGESKPYTLSLDDSSAAYFPDAGETEGVVVPPPLFPWLAERARPLMFQEGILFPDLKVSINGRTVFIDISRPEYARGADETRQALERAGIDMETFYVLENGDGKVDGHLNFEGEVDWSRIVSYLKRKYVAPAGEKRFVLPDASADGAIMAEMAKRLAELFPDTACMMEYVESMGYAAPGTLEMMGYSVKWNGLVPVVERNGG